VLFPVYITANNTQSSSAPEMAECKRFEWLIFVGDLQRF